MVPRLRGDKRLQGFSVGDPFPMINNILILKSAIRLLLIISIVLLAVLAYAEEKRYNVPIDDSPVFGPAEAPVTMIEFLDYQ